jgi:hypothetical protein
MGKDKRPKRKALKIKVKEIHMSTNLGATSKNQEPEFIHI